MLDHAIAADADRGQMYDSPRQLPIERTTRIIRGTHVGRCSLTLEYPCCVVGERSKVAVEGVIDRRPHPSQPVSEPVESIDKVMLFELLQVWAAGSEQIAKAGQ